MSIKSIETLSNTDRTSWRRMCMFARYLWPSLKPMVILYPILAVVVTLIVNFFYQHIGIGWAMQTMSIITMAVLLAPAFLSRQANGEVFYSLPVLGFEKCTVIFGIMFIGVFALFLPAKICGIHIKEEMALEITQDLYFGSSNGVVAVSMLSVLAGEALALWTVFAARRHRAVKSIIAALTACFLVDALIGFIVGFFTALTGGEIGGSLATAIPYVAAFWVICFIFFSYKAARAIARKQV